ncbi:sensor histidine kinase [Microbacterium sp. NPDC057650]|uniref:sensor histidine kinase n=1 Tax=unclassified Microbacterium TaxID=2609290 RepID=UPI0036724BDD
MSSTSEKASPPRLRLRRYRFTVRTRLAVTYAALLTGAGLIMLAIVFVFLGILPTYQFAAPLTPALPPDSGVSSTPSAPSTGFPAQTTEALVVSSLSDVQKLLLVVSAGVLILLAVGGTWAGWLVAGHMLRPLQDVGAAARRAARGDLDHRISLDGPRDEITDLAATFDEMLEELEQSFDSYRRFAANASHELRTPLATSRAMLDVALASAGAAERDLLTRLRAVNERSIETVEALLDLSEIEATAARMDDVDLQVIVEDALRDVSREAETADVVIDAALTTAPIHGDPALLRQLVLNLLQNGIRHNTSGGRLRIATGTNDDRSTELRVTNTGDVLSEETVQRLSEPFVRGDGRTSRASAAGRGLGLSIVAAIVERHRATLRLRPRDGGGLEATVTFPASAPG